ncbi:MAG: hypothetical protein UX62_C0038G0006 [Microgenomates group bacterium GW2011_GWA2_46_7]|nr:MAG: hypothetical protein UX62_C0038G0006 [Microgenomates group bacterium GW2011_GWA2_46_7]
MPKKKSVAKKTVKTAKPSVWMGAYKFAIGGIVVMTILAVGAMVWQYYSFRASEWMFEEPEIDLIEFEKQDGLSVCGSTGETKGGCVTQPLSTPTSGLSCQAINQSAAAAAGVSEAGCRVVAAQMRSWAGAFRTDSCQPGLLFDQKTITSDMLVDKVAKTMRAKPISIAGMHKCVPGLAGRYCPVKDKKGTRTGWEPCYTVALKGACKYTTEQPINIIDGGKKYKFCAPLGRGEKTLEGGTGCYTGSAAKPTVKLCCPAGKTAVSGKCQ